MIVAVGLTLVFVAIVAISGWALVTWPREPAPPEQSAPRVVRYELPLRCPFCRQPICDGDVVDVIVGDGSGQIVHQKCRKASS